MIGVGFEHSNLVLTNSGASVTTKGVFIPTHKHPILILNQANQHATPPPYHQFVTTGELLARQEFRGLFLADHQEALGDKAFKCVD